MSIIVVPYIYAASDLPRLKLNECCPVCERYAKASIEGEWYVCWHCWIAWRLSQDSPRTAQDGADAWEWRAGATGTHDGHWHRGEG